VSNGIGHVDIFQNKQNNISWEQIEIASTYKQTKLINSGICQEKNENKFNNWTGLGQNILREFNVEKG
jgi:hypothetical protein